jgi:limonene 1,2-monooxygenase
LRKNKLRLGVFVPPFWPVKESPTLCFERDLQLAEYCDEIGIAEYWVGEHHSGGWQPIASPELMIAAAAQRTKRVKLGTGVVSLPYHNPLMTANRIAQLDHLTRGRLMFGAGPGLLTADAYMVGIDPRDSRDKLDQGLSVITRLLAGEWVTEETSWYKLQDAHCQVLPCNNALELCVASTMSPNGGVLAAKYNAGMLCLAATSIGGYDALSTNWKVAQGSAAKYGRTMDPSRLRCATDIHIADTREEAMAQVRDGYETYLQYGRTHSKHMKDNPTNMPLEKLIADGDVVVGTVEDAIAQIRRIEAKVPDFGCLLLSERNWARPEHRNRSLELMMLKVLPEINGDNVNREKSLAWFGKNSVAFQAAMKEGAQRAIDKYAAETGKKPEDTTKTKQSAE